jgi:NAD(P)-dependent dehydrogenase (short-subunit alcohol dehydrogenase family)
MRSVVVTGSSSGIGRSTAKLLLAEGFRVFGSALTPAEAREAAGALGPNFTPLVFDVTDEPGVAAAANVVRAALGGQALTGLVNNAGMTFTPQPLLITPIEQFKRQIEINLTGQLIVTQAFAPLLGCDTSMRGEPGRIVMMSSITGRVGWPFGAPYASSKHGLEGLSESLRRELMLFGVDVVIVAPSIVNTPMWRTADVIDLESLQNSPYREPMDRMRDFMLKYSARGLSPERVARLVLKILTARNPRVRYAIGPTPLLEFLVRALPKRIFDRGVATRFRLAPRYRGRARRR